MRTQRTRSEATVDLRAPPQRNMGSLAGQGGYLAVSHTVEESIAWCDAQGPVAFCSYAAGGIAVSMPLAVLSLPYAESRPDS